MIRRYFCASHDGATLDVDAGSDQLVIRVTCGPIFLTASQRRNLASYLLEGLPEPEPPAREWEDL